MTQNLRLLIELEKPAQRKAKTYIQFKFNKINCLIDVRIEISYITYDPISQRVHIQAKDWIFLIRLF